MRVSTLIPSLLLGLSALGATETEYRTIEMPQVPEGLTEPRDRANYVSMHFWDALDFGSPEAAVDTGLVEQSMVDFVSLLPHGDVAPQAISRLLERASTNAQAYALVTYEAEKYLYETDSPMLDEEMYAQFLSVMDTLAVTGEAERLRIRYKLDQISKCRPGSAMPDMELSDGTTLAQATAGAPAIILYYDHDCESCQATIEEMMSDTRLTGVLSDGRLRVLAVDMAEESGGRQPQASGWIWSRAADPDADITMVYPMRQTPSLYLTGADGRILLKDVSYGRLAEAIFH